MPLLPLLRAHFIASYISGISECGSVSHFQPKRKRTLARGSNGKCAAKFISLYIDLPLNLNTPLNELLNTMLNGRIAAHFFSLLLYHSQLANEKWQLRSIHTRSFHFLPMITHKMCKVSHSKCAIRGETCMCLEHFITSGNSTWECVEKCFQRLDHVLKFYRTN